MTKTKWTYLFGALLSLNVHAAQEFLYNRDGFSFHNYGNHANPVNLTPGNMERLCGTVSCVRGSGEDCALRAPVRVLMQKYNNIMDNGHCEGFSAVSEGLFTGKIPMRWLDPYAKSTFALKPTPRVQSEIAYWFSTQFTNPTHTSKRLFQVNQALNVLRNTGGESYSMQMFNPKKPGALVNEGHTVTPFKVIDEPNDKAKIAVYDSNYPNETRLIFVDKKTNTWH